MLNGRHLLKTQGTGQHEAATKLPRRTPLLGKGANQHPPLNRMTSPDRLYRILYTVEGDRD